MFTHVGWIPCINGHLDFGLATPVIKGSFSYDDFIDVKTSKINFGYLREANHHARRIILQSKVDWRDTLKDEYDGQFRVIVVAEANESSDLDERDLKGKIFIYPIAQEPKDLEARKNMPWFENIHEGKKILTDLKEKSVKWKDAQAKLNKVYENTETSLSSKGNAIIKQNFHEVDFTIDSKGFALLKASGDTTKCEAEIQYPIIRQAFYYIKYSIHSHKHHHNKQDSLTTVIPLEDQQKGISKIESLKMLGQLKRELTNLKRTYSNGGRRAYGEEQGILSYMNSLCASLKSKGFISDDIFSREAAYLDSLSRSFTVQTDKRDKRDQVENDISARYRVYVTWGFSLVSIAWLLIIKGYLNYTESNQITFNFALWESSTVFISILALSFLAYQYLVRRRLKITIHEEGFKTWIETVYDIEDAHYRKYVWNRIFRIIGTAIIPIIIIATLHFLVS